MAALLPALAIGIFLVALDQTLTIATYGKIGTELRALNSTSWIATSYFLTLTTFQPLYGKLSNIFGRKACLLFAYAVFGLGCLGCGAARNIVQLCVARAVAGAGGGGMNVLVGILVTDLVPLRDRGVWQGYTNIVFCTGLSTGAPLGGLLADRIGWRWTFTAQFPLAIIAFVAVYFALNIPKKQSSATAESPDQRKADNWTVKLRRIDVLGALTLVAAVFALLFGLDNGSNEGWTKKITYIPLFIISPLLFAFFIFVEAKIAREPFAPGHVVFDRPLLAAYGANFFGVAAYLGVSFFIALFFQAALGVSATVAGVWLVPATLSGLVGSLGGGWVMKRTGKFYWITVGSLALLLLATVPMVLGVRLQSAGLTIASLVALVLGTSCAITTTLIAIIANAESADMAIALACSYLFRSLGSTIGISISTATLQQMLRVSLASELGGEDDKAREIEEGVRQSLDYIRSLDPALAAVVRRCYAVATQWAFVPVAAFAVLAILASLFIREKRLDRS
ncbi:MFS general substrate transporter [Xylariaceae sp. FL0255]|nr:MFS general substrate transporter [Xylariaceae sp. FL0255]